LRPFQTLLTQGPQAGRPHQHTRTVSRPSSAGRRTQASTLPSPHCPDGSSRNNAVVLTLSWCGVPVSRILFQSKKQALALLPPSLLRSPEAGSAAELQLTFSGPGPARSHRGLQQNGDDGTASCPAFRTSQCTV